MYMYGRTRVYLNDCLPYYILAFASEIANLLIAFASHKARKVRYEYDTIAFPVIANTVELAIRNSYGTCI